ncbi:OprD family porin [Shewanella insulae]|uniref:OprD family outer membrane porin n=1 Tax=Shewanella insulae TaxID=2681496 RepID=UPI001EFD0D46|nr:OprD family outer membrane porin [Shewanella insulae]MCG9757300.1 OprD family porin [Shewanella insulae]
MMKKNYLSLLVMSAIALPAAADTSLDQMFTQGSLRGELRLFDFTRDFDGDTNTKHDTSLGGLFYYKTAAVNGISIGTSFASANSLWTNDSDSFYGLVGPNHENVNRLQEYFVQGEWWNTKFKYGAQELRTPMMNPHDIRAIPRTFRGFTAYNNSVDNLTLSALYITDSMGWFDNQFVTVAEAVASEVRRTTGQTVEVADNPVYALGGKYKLQLDGLKGAADLWHYRMEDVFNQTFVKLNLSMNVGNANLYVTPSYLTQQSSGKETAGELDTYQYGAHLGVKYAGLNLTYMYAKTGDDTVLTPWGDDKVVIQQVNQSARANETVNALRAAYDFDKLGAKGLSAYVFYGDFDVPESTGSDFTETNFSVSYSLDSLMKGLSVRARHAIVDYDNGEDLTDTRFYIKYKFTLGI